MSYRLRTVVLSWVILLIPLEVTLADLPHMSTSPPRTQALSKSDSSGVNQILVKEKVTGELRWQVTAVGGNISSSASVVLSATLGQAIVGATGGSQTRNIQGFWQAFPGCCLGVTGNADGDPDDVVDISDLTAMGDYLFKGVPLPSDCFAENDVDISGSIDISDLQILVDYLFLGGQLMQCP